MFCRFTHEAYCAVMEDDSGSAAVVEMEFVAILSHWLPEHKGRSNSATAEHQMVA